MAKKQNDTGVPAFLLTWQAELILGVVFLVAAVVFFLWGHNPSNNHGFLGYLLGILFVLSALKTFNMAYHRLSKK